MDKARSLGLALIALSFVEFAWVAFCIFGGGILGLMSFVDEEFAILGLVGGGAYAVLAFSNAIVAGLHLAAGVQLRKGRGLLLAIAALAACMVQLVFALYCFPFEIGVLIYGIVVLSDAEVRKVLEGDGA